ncbi:MAG: hypothetical protein Q6K90_04840 [Gloeomargarita sp. HHBFW_bins_162]
MILPAIFSGIALLRVHYGCLPTTDPEPHQQLEPVDLNASLLDRELSQIPHWLTLLHATVVRLRALSTG